MNSEESLFRELFCRIGLDPESVDGGNMGGHADAEGAREKKDREGLKTLGYRGQEMRILRTSGFRNKFNSILPTLRLAA